MYNNRMRTRLILGLWLIGVLFPAIWLRKFSTTYRQIFDTLFGTEWVHIAMHLMLYAVLAVLLISVLRLPLNRKGMFRLALSILAAGILQEIFQAISQGMPLLQVDTLRLALFDLGIDLSGGLVGAVILYLTASTLARWSKWQNLPT